MIFALAEPVAAGLSRRCTRTVRRANHRVVRSAKTIATYAGTFLWASQHIIVVAYAVSAGAETTNGGTSTQALCAHIWKGAGVSIVAFAAGVKIAAAVVKGFTLIRSARIAIVAGNVFWGVNAILRQTWDTEVQGAGDPIVAIYLVAGLAKTVFARVTFRTGIAVVAGDRVFDDFRGTFSGRRIAEV